MKVFGYEIFNKVVEVPDKSNVGLKIVEQQTYRQRQDIGKWRTATSAAENIYNPNRIDLLQIYKDVVLDSQITALWSQRLNGLKSKPYKLVSKSGAEIANSDDLIKKEWVNELMCKHIDSIMYGFGILQIEEYDITELDVDFDEIDRLNIIPEKKEVKATQYEMSGVSIEEPQYYDWTVFLGEEKDLGLLHKLTPFALYKKNVLGAWSQFTELFGIPMRIGKTNVHDDKLRANMMNMLKNMGSAGSAVMDENDVVEIIQTNNQDSYKVFEQLLKYCDESISKLILGQTMTSDNGSSKSQAEVHATVSEAYTMNDCYSFECLMNEEILPRLVKIGFPYKGMVFKFDNVEKIPLKDKMEMVTKLLQWGKNIPDEYILAEFGIPTKDKLQTKQLTNQLNTIKNELSKFYS